jgi:hypothetical protein
MVILAISFFFRNHLIYSFRIRCFLFLSTYFSLDKIISLTDIALNQNCLLSLIHFLFDIDVLHRLYLFTFILLITSFSSIESFISFHIEEFMLF